AFLDDAQIVDLERFRLLRGYLEQKREEVAAWNRGLGAEGKVRSNTRRLTNLGTFRAYALAWLKAHPRIHQQMTILVRQLDIGSEGVPLEIYCFTATTAWAEYESIQSDIFDHLIAILPEFGLRLYQKPAGSDVLAAAEALRAATAERPGVLASAVD